MNESNEDEAVYRREMEELFVHCWFWMGHLSQVPHPGDFATGWMGNQPVLLWRDREGQLRVFYNRCPHEGAKVCVFDQGQAETLSCGAHWWTFRPDGVFLPAEGFVESAERETTNLTEIPRFEVRAGFIFGSLDPSADGLKNALGEFAPWWDCLAVWGKALGGWEPLAHSQRWRLSAGWKDFAIAIDHDPCMSLLRRPELLSARLRTVPSLLSSQGDPGPLQNRVKRWESEEVLSTNAQVDGDPVDPSELGSEAREFFEEASNQWDELCKRLPGPSPAPGTNAMFPNLIFGGINQLTGLSLLQVQPRRVNETEILARHFMPRGAPSSLRSAALNLARQGGLRPVELDLPAPAQQADLAAASRGFHARWAHGMGTSS